MNKKEYHIDNKPASARDVIKAALEYDGDFTNQFIQQTSEAVKILREHGHIVEDLDKSN